MQSYRSNSIPPSFRKVAEDSPSFSSSLLDSIYRSIDDTDGTHRNEMKKKQINSNRGKMIPSGKEADRMRPTRGIMIEKWMQKKKTEEFHSCSTSSASSSAGGFSSSEPESFRGIGYTSKESRINLLKPVRTCVHPDHPRVLEEEVQKSMAETIKKAKQPISPGAKIARFLNSLFTKHKLSSSSGKVHSSHGNPIASSSSRSCLSKTQLSNGNAPSAGKRSVRFYPISVVLDEDSRPCGHKNLHGQKSWPTNCSMEDRIAENSRRRVGKLAEDLVNKYQQKMHFNIPDRHMELIEDDDCASCSSSDLFELESLSIVGADQYQELPVYETTSLDSNRAIANRLIL